MGRKQLYEYFKGQIKKIAHEMTYTRPESWNVKSESESRLITGQNNAVRTNQVKVRYIIRWRIDYGVIETK